MGKRNPNPITIEVPGAAEFTASLVPSNVFPAVQGFMAGAENFIKTNYGNSTVIDFRRTARQIALEHVQDFEREARAYEEGEEVHAELKQYETSYSEVLFGFDLFNSRNYPNGGFCNRPPGFPGLHKLARTFDVVQVGLEDKGYISLLEPR